MKLMILGGSENQKPIFERALDMGIETVLCDYSDSAVCIELADVFYNASILDYESVLDVAKKEEIDGILTNSELALGVAAEVANELGIPSNSLSTIETLMSKSIFRDFLSRNGFYSPKSILIEDIGSPQVVESLSELNYPIIVKPVDSSASRGVTRAENFDEAVEAVSEAAEYSRSEMVVAEEFITRDHDFVIGGDVYVYESHVVFWGIMNSFRDKYGNDNVPTGTSFPTYLTKKRKKIFEEQLSRLIKLSGVEFGSFNIEAVFDSDDNLFFIEINPRNGGNSIPKLLELSTGIDLNVFNIKSALGMEIHEEEYSDYDINPMMTHIVHSNKEGFFDRVDISEDCQKKVFDLKMDIEKGDKVEAFNSGDKMLGTIFMKFESLEEMKSCTDCIDDQIKVKLIESQNEKLNKSEEILS